MINNPDALCRYSSDPARLSVEAVATLYGSVGFGEAARYRAMPDLLRHLFGPGRHGFFALAPDGGLVGMVRVFSDDLVCSWIAELCVHPDWQGKGIGRHLLSLTLARFGHTDVYAEAFPGQEALFAAHGIKPRHQLVACSRAGRSA